MDHLRSIVSWIMTSALTLGTAAGVVVMDRGPQAPTTFVTSETTVAQRTVVHRSIHRSAAVTHRVVKPTVTVKKTVHLKVAKTQATITTTEVPTTTVVPTTTTTVAATTTTTAPAVVVTVPTTIPRHHDGGDDGGGSGGGGTTSTTIDN